MITRQEDSAQQAQQRGNQPITSGNELILKTYKVLRKLKMLKLGQRT